MRNTTKLLPVLLLGTALTGCSMAGTSDFSANHNAQAGYWGADTSSCNQPSPCEQAYAPAPQAFAGQQGCAVQPVAGQPVFAGQQGCAAQPVFAGQQGFTGQPGFTGQQGFAGQPGFAGQQGFAGQPGFAGQQQFVGQPGFAGQQGFAGQPGFAAPAYVPPFANARGGSSRGLRQAYTYGTLGATLYDVDSDFIGIQGRLGWQSKSFFGAEVEGSLGVSDDDATVDFGTGPVDSEVEIDTQIAAFAVGRFPVSNQFNVLGRVGYHNTELDAEFDDGVTQFEQDFSTDGFAYGVGVEYALNRNTAIRADYTVYDFDGPDADALSLAISRKF